MSAIDTPPSADSSESLWVLFCAHIAQSEASTEALLAALQDGLTHHPRSARLLYNLGVAHLRLKDNKAAQLTWQQLLALDAKHLKAHRRLADLALEQGEASLAGQLAEQALIISRETHPPHGDLIDWTLVGQCLLACGEWDEARTWLEQAQHVAELTSTNDSTRHQLAEICKRSQLLSTRGQGDLTLQDLLTLQDALSKRHKACDWREFGTWHHVMRRIIALAKTDSKIGLHPGLAWEGLHMKLSHAELQILARAACQHIRQTQQPHFLWTPSNGFSNRQRLRIGYVSYDFKTHPVGQLMHQIIRDHDRVNFEVFAYAMNKNDGSDIYGLIQHSVDHFADVSQCTPRIVAERILQDEIDVLIAMGGHTAGQVADVCLWRSAPVQINYLAFNGTVGAGDAIDAHLCDKVACPPEYATWFDESLYLLPSGHSGYNNERTVLDCPSHESIGLPSKGLVLSGFNNSYKIEPETFDAWCEIMRQLPESVLWLYAVHGEQKHFLKLAAQARGIDADRLLFAPSNVDTDAHLARLGCIDLYLDAFVHNGYTTMLDVLFAGIPAITRCGSTLSGRVGSSFLLELGLEDCVTNSTDAFIARAVELANDPERRQAIRQHLLASRKTRLPFCSKQRARQLEVAYRQLWEQKRSRLGVTAPQA